MRIKTNRLYVVAARFTLLLFVFLELYSSSHGLTCEEPQKWTVDSLRKYLMDRGGGGVPLSGGSRKADLIRKCVLTDEPQLPILPSAVENRLKLLRGEAKS